MATIGSGSVASYTIATGSDTGIGRVDQSAIYPYIDLTAPVAAVNTPVAGSTLAAKTTALVLDVTDDSALKRVIIYATHSDSTPPEIVYDGTSFSTAYDASSAVSVISGGKRYSVVRDLGWRTNPSLHIYALDDAATLYHTRNELDFTTFSWVFTPDVTGPAIAANTPGAGTTLATKSTAVTVNVTDASTISRTLLVAKFSDSGPDEVVWDGSAQGTGYTVATGVVAGGTSYQISRDDYWRSDPKIYLYALDQFGNERLWGHVDYVFSPDSARPAFVAVSPAAASTLGSAFTPISFNITETSGIDRIVLMVTFADGTTELVYDDMADDFDAKYIDDSSQALIGGGAGGMSFTIQRNGVGWLGNPTFHAYARDGNENELQFSNGSIAYVFVPDADEPEIAANSPTEGSTLPAKDTEISLDITDASSLGTLILLASYGDGKPEEVVWDGSVFQTGYTGLAEEITGGFRFTFTRDAGWRKDPTFTHYAKDALGNEALP